MNIITPLFIFIHFIIVVLYYFSTCRDGSPVELVGLSYSAISWLSSLHDKGQYPFNGVYTTGDKSPGMGMGLVVWGWVWSLWWYGNETGDMGMRLTCTLKYYFDLNTYS